MKSVTLIVALCINFGLAVFFINSNAGPAADVGELSLATHPANPPFVAGSGFSPSPSGTHTRLIPVPVSLNGRASWPPDVTAPGSAVIADTTDITKSFAQAFEATERSIGDFAAWAAKMRDH